MKLRFVVMLALVVALIAPMAATTRAQAGTIVDVAAGAGTFKTLVAAVEAAGLVDTLKGAGPFTVFAPTDEAFAKLPPLVVEYLLKPEQKDLLTRILTYHVVAGEVKAEAVMGMNGQMAKTVEGGEVMVTVAGDKVRVNSANVTSVDVMASNGVIHVIDTVILPEITLPEVDPVGVKGNVITAGSSTVFPLSRAVTQLFKDEGFADNVEVASVGTGAGFERFCKAGETDISNASARIKQSQIDECKAINRDPIEFFLAIDALAVVVGNETSYVDNLTLAQLADVFSGKAKTWNEVNPAWPNDAIKIFSPGTDSGTFEYFVEIVFKKDKKPILEAAGAQFSEDDNVLVEGVAGTKGAIGYFGFAYYLPNTDKLKSVNVEGVVANEVNAESGLYPLARPLFIYTTAAILQEKPQVASFVNFYLTRKDEVLGTEAGKIAYFPTNRDARNLNKVLFLAATSK